MLALDLPGFGRSSKPLKGYDFAFFDRVLDGFLEPTGIEKAPSPPMTSAVRSHCTGGCTDKSGYPALPYSTHLSISEFAPSVIDFVRGLMPPERRKVMTCPEGLAESMRAGVADGSALGHDVSVRQLGCASGVGRAGIGFRANGLR